ncbi:MAG: hypothetical protein ACXVCY_14575 [Pseudobdellovibrionaceae bacterium]
MDRFKVTGSDLRNFYKENVSLGRVFSDIEQDLRSTNQVVCRYIINGLAINECDEERFSIVKLSEIETLEYLTENSRDLLVLVIKGWIESLPELMNKTESLTKRMRVQGTSGLLKPIHDLVQNCEFLIDSIMTIKTSMGDQFLGASSINWFAAEEASKEAVGQALAAMESRKIGLLADVLDYDLIHVLQMWLDHLIVLEKTLNEENIVIESKPRPQRCSN